MKFYRNDIGSLTSYYLSEFANKNNLDFGLLENLYLECITRDLPEYILNEVDKIEEEIFEKGESKGYDEGYNEGYDQKQNDDLENNNYVLKSVAEEKSQESWKLGYRTGYKDGIDWKLPQSEEDILTKYANSI
jgi:opacity protein-like surface antigen